MLDPEVVAQLLTRRSKDARMARLTPRERTVLAALAEGRSNQAIAALLSPLRGERREAHHRNLSKT